MTSEQSSSRRERGVVTIPQSVVGLQLEPFGAPIEAGRLRFFAEAIGETDPVFTDRSAAAAAGYADLPVPPTFFFGLKLDAPDPFRWLLDLEVDFRYVLHGSQKFTYHRMAFAGNEVVMQSRVVGVTEKKAGALEFLDLETSVRRGEESIATLLETIVVRHPELENSR
jgi:acyl dehydratase